MIIPDLPLWPKLLDYHTFLYHPKTQPFHPVDLFLHKFPHLDSKIYIYFVEYCIIYCFSYVHTMDKIHFSASTAELNCTLAATSAKLKVKKVLVKR